MDNYDKDTSGERDTFRTKDDIALSDRLHADWTDGSHRTEDIDTVADHRGEAIGGYEEARTGFGVGKRPSSEDTQDIDFHRNAGSADHSYERGYTGFGSHTGRTGIPSNTVDSGRLALDPEYPGSNKSGVMPDATDYDRPQSGLDHSEYVGDDTEGRVDVHAPTAAPVSSTETGNTSIYGGHAEGGVGTTTTSYNEEKSPTNEDSTMGKMMEKAGDLLKNENLAEKGREKREAAGDSGTACKY